MYSLPSFNSEGLLPPGDYLATFNDLRQSVLVLGSGSSPTWDSAWRLHLVDQCEILVRQLWKVGIKNIFLNGSFVEEKDHPNDIDGYFECDLMDFVNRKLEQQLNALDPYKVWIWDHTARRPVSGSAKKQLPMWHYYRTELYPEYGQSSGITDRYGNPLLFPSAFRQQRLTYRPKGIIKIIP